MDAMASRLAAAQSKKSLRNELELGLPVRHPAGKRCN
jgi:hypothetical protein